MGVERVLDEGLRGPFGIVPIPQRQRTAANAEFPRFIHFGRLILPVKNQDVGVAARKANRQLLIIRKLAVHDEASAIHGYFNWTIEIDEHRPRQVATPVIEVLGGKHFTREQHLLESVEFPLSQQILVGNVHHNRRYPENETDVLCRQKFDYFCGESGQPVGDDDQSSPLGEAEEKFQRIDVEVKRRQTADDFAPIQREVLKSPVHEVNCAAVVQRHAFRYAGRTRSVNDAKRIGIDHQIQSCQQRRIVINHLSRHGLFHEEQLAFGNAERAQCGDVGRGSDDDAGAKILQDTFQPLWWRFDIKIGVAIAGIKNAQVSDDFFSTFGKKHRHRLLDRRGFSEDQGCAVLGEPLNFSKRVFASLFLDRHLFSVFKQSSVFEVFNNVYLHVGGGAAV